MALNIVPPEAVDDVVDLLVTAKMLNHRNLGDGDEYALTILGEWAFQTLALSFPRAEFLEYVARILYFTHVTAGTTYDRTELLSEIERHLNSQD